MKSGFFRRKSSKETERHYQIQTSLLGIQQELVNLRLLLISLHQDIQRVITTTQSIDYNLPIHYPIRNPREPHDVAVNTDLDLI